MLHYATSLPYVQAIDSGAAHLSEVMEPGDRFHLVAFDDMSSEFVDAFSMEYPRIPWWDDLAVVFATDDDLESLRHMRGWTDEAVSIVQTWVAHDDDFTLGA